MKRKRQGASFDKAVIDLCQRESGLLHPKNFSHRLRASEDFILRLAKLRTLERHRGCVNTISFNANGKTLVSGSDDRKIILWDWETGKVNLSFDSGHSNNVFQAKFMPYSDDRSIVTCAADGQVRHFLIPEHEPVVTTFLGKHDGQAHKLAIEPGSPNVFYTCGEDGIVKHFDLRTKFGTTLFACKEPKDRLSRSKTVPLTSIAIDPRNPSFFAIAGSDNFARLYDIRMWDGSSDFGRPINYFSPHHVIHEKRMNITGLAFSEESELLVSYNAEFIYLFKRDMGLGQSPLLSLVDEEIDANLIPQSYIGHRNIDTVKGVSFLGPRCEYVASGSDCGRIFIWRKRGGELIRVIEADRLVVNCVESHPQSDVVASSGIENDIKIWTPTAIERATLPIVLEKVILPYRFEIFPYDYDYDFDDDDDDDVDDDDDDDDSDDIGDEGEDDFDDDDDYDDDDCDDEEEETKAVDEEEETKAVDEEEETKAVDDVEDENNGETGHDCSDGHYSDESCSGSLESDD